MLAEGPGAGLFPGEVDVDDQAIYWAWGELGPLFRLSKYDGSVTELVSEPAFYYGLSVDGGVLFAATSAPAPPDAPRRIVKFAPGSPPMVVVTAPGYIKWLVAAHGRVFWSDSSAGSIMSVPALGGAVEVVASGQAGPGGLGKSDARVFWTNNADGNIVSAPQTGGPTVVVFDGPPKSVGTAVWRPGVFFFGQGADTCEAWSVPETGGSATFVTSCEAWALAKADARYVYWTTAFSVAPSTVQYMPVEGGTATSLASGGNGSMAIALDDDFVYWIESHRLMKVAKP